MSFCHVGYAISKQVISNRWLEENSCEKSARAKSAKLLVFIVTYANFWRARLPRRHGYLRSL